MTIAEIVMAVLCAGAVLNILSVWLSSCEAIAKQREGFWARATMMVISLVVSPVAWMVISVRLIVEALT